jgi:hypothetical protein
MLDPKLEIIKKEMYLKDSLNAIFEFDEVFTDLFVYRYKDEKGLHIIEVRAAKPRFSKNIRGVQFIEMIDLLSLRYVFYTKEEIRKIDVRLKPIVDVNYGNC